MADRVETAERKADSRYRTDQHERQHQHCAQAEKPVQRRRQAEFTGHKPCNAPGDRHRRRRAGRRTGAEQRQGEEQQKSQGRGAPVAALCDILHYAHRAGAGVEQKAEDDQSQQVQQQQRFAGTQAVKTDAAAEQNSTIAPAAADCCRRPLPPLPAPEYGRCQIPVPGSEPGRTKRVSFGLSCRFEDIGPAGRYPDEGTRRTDCRDMALIAIQA